MSKTQHKAVIRYYEETDWDHRYVWHRGPYQAAHFGIYDETARNHKAALINTNEVMARIAGITPGMQILDAGCGWGGSALWLAKEKKVKVIGVNITGYQINECKDKAKRLGLQKECTFIESDYCDTPFADEQFDVVWSCESLCHAANKKDFYLEASRILKPGGRLILADYHRELPAPDSPIPGAREPSPGAKAARHPLPARFPFRAQQQSTGLPVAAGPG
jgi:cyclopropane fatty-acyl-phospholipid synthase-like methyltransferase